MPVRKLKYKSRMDHSHLKFQKLGKKIRKTCWLSIINHFFPNKLVETSGDCEWTDNFEDTGRRQTIQTYNTHTHTIRPTPTCCPQLSAPLSKQPSSPICIRYPDHGLHLYSCPLPLFFMLLHL